MSRLRGNWRNNETSNIDETSNVNHTTKLCWTTLMDKVYKEFFKVYLTECEKTRKLMKQENEQKEFTKELITTVNDTSSQTRISKLETSTMMVNKLDAGHCNSTIQWNSCFPRKFLPNYNDKETPEKTNHAKLSKRKATCWITILKNYIREAIGTYKTNW